MSLERLIQAGVPAEGAPQPYKTFSDEAIRDLTKNFYRDMSGAQNLNHSIEALWLTPILTYVHTLKTHENEINSFDNQQHDYSGLLALIEDKKKNIVNEYTNFLTIQLQTPTHLAAQQQIKKILLDVNDVIFTDILTATDKTLSKAIARLIQRDQKKIIAALSNMQYLIHVSIERSEPDFLAATKTRIQTAKSEINQAQLKKVYDYCCMLVCAGWSIPENMLTCLNCCENGAEPSQELCFPRLPHEPGRFNLFAPCNSIRNFKLDVDRHNETIMAQAPQAQRMV